MPVLSSFYGIVIKMYFQQSEHNPPHVHAFYNGEYMGAINIKTAQLMEGDLPPRALKIVQEWVTLNRETLLEIWESQTFVSVPPLP